MLKQAEQAYEHRRINTYATKLVPLRTQDGVIGLSGTLSTEVRWLWLVAGLHMECPGTRK